MVCCRVVVCLLLYLAGFFSGVSGQPHGSNHPCGASWIRCNASRLCIPQSLLCNGYNNCGDWEDEHHCPTPPTISTPPVSIPPCAPDQVPCNSTGTCIPRQVLCDGYNNCGDGEDEKGCPDSPVPSGCGDSSIQKGSQNSISSMNYPYSNYDDNAHCLWHIVVDFGQYILLQFDPLFDVQDNSTGMCQRDFLIVYDSYIFNIMGIYCGTKAPSPILVKSEHAVVRFSSDNTTNGRGFGIHWSAVPPTAAILTPPTVPTTTTITTTPSTASQACGGKEAVLHGDSGVLESPGYSLSSSAHYPPSSHCAWRILAPPHSIIRLHFHDFMLESSPNCTSDTLAVYDGGDETGALLGTFCGKYSPPDINSSDRQLFLLFFSDGGVEGRGFQVTWATHTVENNTHTPQTTPAPGTGCDGTALPQTSPSGVVTSPGFDGFSAYAGNLNCQWHIQVQPGYVVELRFTSFDLEWTRGCSYDFVIIYDGSDYGKEKATLCGDRPPPEYTSTSNSVFIKFHSDEEVGGYGFNLTYTSHPGGAKCTASEFSCSTGQCIPYDQVCNGHPNCPHGDDEIICPNRADCGRPLITPQLEHHRIVGGREAVEGSWPWQASLRMVDKHMCGGSLIHPLWILTATHCFDSNWRKEDWTVMLGQQELRTTSPHQQLFNVSDIILRDDYDDVSSDNDVALIKLARPAAMTPYVQLACLASIVLPPEKICYVTGFGETMSTCCAGKLKQAAVPLIDRKTCNRPDWYDHRVLPNMVCAGYEEGRVDSCGGDSGGPLACKTGRHWVVYGVTSWGVTCAGEKSPGVYTRVTDYVKWIQETVAKHS